MSTRGESSGSAAVGGDRRARRPRAGLVAGLTAALVAGLLALTVVPAAAAAAATTPATTADATPVTAATSAPTSTADRTPAPTAGPTPAPGTTQADLQAQPTPGGVPTAPAPPSSGPAVDPTIADPGDLTSATGRFQGTATAGHRVRVIDPALTSRSVCTATTATDGTWTCSGPVTTGPQQVFTVQDVSDTSRRTADAPAADVVVPPVISTREPTTGTVVGTGHVGTTISVSVSGSSAVRTAGGLGGDGRWIVSWSTGAPPHPSGTVTMTATATASTADGFRSDLRSAASAPATRTFDRTPPDAPTVTSPRTRQRVAAQDLVVRGTGEPRAELTVYVDRAPVCGATVRADGTWACSTSGAPAAAVGEHTVTALQHDAAGNHSTSSAPVQVDVATATPGTTGSPSGHTGGSSPAGGGPGSPTSSSGGPSHGAGAGPDGPGSATGGTPSDGAATTPGGTDAGGPGVQRQRLRLLWSGRAGDWLSSDRVLVPPSRPSSRPSLGHAGGRGCRRRRVPPPRRRPRPSRRRTLRGRVSLRLASFTGRNRPRTERTRGDDALPAWASIGSPSCSPPC